MMLVRQFVIQETRKRQVIRQGTAFLVSLLVSVCLLLGCGGEPVGPPPDDSPGSISIEALAEATNSRSLFEKLKLPKVHQEFQRSYIDLVNKINSVDTSKGFDVKETQRLFTDYSFAFKKYRDVMLEIAKDQKESKLRCFSIMKSLILAVVVYDRKGNKKMFKFDQQKLMDAGIIQDVTPCPSNGEFSIFYKDSRPFFHCSVHGTLKAN